MKLSEAIRLGAMLRPQVFGDYFISGGSCAVGAAAEACGIAESGTQRFRVFEHSHVSVFARSCPVCGFPPSNVVVHLNDWHRWTRERIADWVATVEPKDALVPVSPTLTAIDRQGVVEGTRR